MNRRRLAAAIAAVWIPAGACLAATTYFVSTTGTDSANCGTSSAPCRSIQVAIDKCVDGDTVRVRNGTYNECVFVETSPGAGAITLETEAFAQNGTRDAVTLDGNGACDEASTFPGPVVQIYDRSILRGFKIQHGGDSGVWGFGAVAITNNTITANTTPTSAGGLYAYTGYFVTDPAAKLEIKLNTISSNTAKFDGGGALVIATAVGVDSQVEIQNNIIRTNTAGPDPRPTAPQTFGGGLTVLTDTALDTDHSTVVITNNTIEGNTLHNPAVSGEGSYGGGLFVATGVYAGYGTESVVIGDVDAGANSIRTNTSGGYGGGISANVQPGVGGHHTIVVAGNAVSANTAGRGGGGIHGFFLTRDPGSPGTGVMQIDDNAITGNDSLSLPTSGNLGGGGLFAEMYSLRTPGNRAVFQIRRNAIQLNTSKSLGGGASIFAYAQDDDPDIDAQLFQADSVIEFENNLVTENDALNSTGGGALGGGVWSAGRAFGEQALAAVHHDFLTVAGNERDAGAGGIEMEAYPELDTGDTLGNVEMTITNSIIANNEGFAAGGTIAPGGTVTVDIEYNDAFQNGGATANWESQLGVTTGTNGNISVDPALDNLFVPQLCSPTIDAGDPAIPVLGDPDPEATGDDEPQPNGNRVNMGHLGATDNATRTLPDANGDGVVDGIDILKLAIAFGAIDPDGRYDADVDFDFDGNNDGSDLSYLASLYARSCP